MPDDPQHQTTPAPLVFVKRPSVQSPPRHKWIAYPQAGEGWRMCVHCCLMQQPGEFRSTKRYTVPECH